MGAMFFAFLMIFVIVFCGIIILPSFLIKNKRIKYILRIISLVIMGLPVSWIIFLLFVNLTPQAIGIYLITVNIFGILGNILYKAYLNIFKKKINKHISRALKIFLYICILSDPFPILMYLTSIISK